MSEPAVPAELAQAVQVWQRRNPLARRLAAGDVGGIGLVRLPLDADLQPLFSPQPFIPGLPMARVLKLLLAHGFEVRPGEAGWPVRELDPAEPGSAGSAGPNARWLITVTIPDARGRPRRLLIGRSFTDPRGRAHTPVLGRRPLSPWRGAAAGLLGLALVLTAVIARPSWPGWLAAGPGSLAAAASAPPRAVMASGIEAAASGTLGGPASAGRSASERASEAASAAASSVAGAQPASTADADAAPSWAAASAAATPAGPPTAGTSAALAPGRLAPAPEPRSWALVSAPTRRRAELEQSQRRLPRWVLASNSGLHAEVMETPQGWVLTIWPLASAEQAERLAASLRSQGLPMVLIDF